MVIAMLRSLRRILPLVALFAATSMRAQGAVAGQVSIMERPGDKTEDLANTVIYLEPVGGAKVAAKAANTNIDMKDRNFSPHIRVVAPGSKVAFPNKDPWKHNVFSKAVQGPFDTDLYGAGKTKDNVFAQAGVYPIYCNIHPRMTAYVLALPTPYVTQAGIDGRFTIAKVPAGTYKLHVWHERAQEQVVDVTVAATGLASLKYQLDGRNYKYTQHKNKTGAAYVFTGDIY
jgi:plastocyanin